jgi:hypothetical protein
VIVAPVAVALIAFFAIIFGLGPELFGGCSLVGAAVAFRRRRSHWWGLAAATAGLVAGAGFFFGWALGTVLVAAVVSFAVVLLLRIVGHRAGAARR